MQSGELATYDPSRLTGVSVYREVTHDFSVRDRIQFIRKHFSTSTPAALTGKNTSPGMFIPNYSHGAPIRVKPSRPYVSFSADALANSGVVFSTFLKVQRLYRNEGKFKVIAWSARDPPVCDGLVAE